MFGPATPNSLRSNLYECSIRHERYEPRRYSLKHGCFFFALDLDEVDSLAASLRFFGCSQSSLYRFCASDHLLELGREPTQPLASLEDNAAGLKRSVVAWAHAQDPAVPQDPDRVRVTLLTLPRFLGYVFNPVSFYFLQPVPGTHDAASEGSVEGCWGAIAEVGNTFGEMKPYWVPAQQHTPSVCQARLAKDFYVSPFSVPDLDFEFRLGVPGENLHVVVQDRIEDRLVLHAQLTGRRRPLTDSQLLRLTCRYPLVTLRVITMIHWHALRLWMRRLPWYRKTDRLFAQRDVYRSENRLRLSVPTTPRSP